MYSRSKKICDLALKRKALNDRLSPKRINYCKSGDNTISQNNDHIPLEMQVSPLPADANTEEIQDLMDLNIISADENYTDDIAPLPLYFEEDISTADDNKNFNNNDTPHLSPDCTINHLMTTDDVAPLPYFEQDISTADDKENSNNNDTPHPSPDCTLNHLDFDCENHFCSWFVGQTICPLSHQSSNWSNITSNLSTPQANTPMSSILSDSTPKSRTRKASSRKDKGNIRRRHMNEWVDVKRKRLRNLGQEYKSRNGTSRSAKELGAKCLNTCRSRCFEKITEEQRLTIFRIFWELGDRDKQWELVAKLALKEKKRRVYTDTDSRRNFTIKYHLPVNRHGEKELIKVCKKMFLGTFSVSEQFVYTALDKLDNLSGLTKPDQRGRHNNHPKVITDDIQNSVCDHIRAIKPIESHYVRKKSSKLYFDSDLNFNRLFQLYNEWYNPEIYTSKAQTERQYRDIVNENFKISFFKPKKDQCDQCHTFNQLDDPTNEERKNHDIHVNNKNLARQLKLSDKQEANSSNGKILTATFDFQNVLNSPHGQLSIFYYKRRLSVFDFTIFNLAEKEGTCYMWHEGQGKRGSNEVTSCLLNFITKRCELGTKEFRFWSDNCPGQNRNRIVYIFYLYVVNKYNITVKHTFLEKGHTQNEGDSVHALIERKASKRLIYTPSEWHCLGRWAKQDGKPYNVVEMQNTDFFDFKAFLQGHNWTKDLNGKKVQWNKMKEISITPDDPYKINFKYHLSSSFYSTLALRSNTRGRHRAAINYSRSPQRLYPNLLPIPKDKKLDLVSMCKSGVIPSSYHNFFNNLNTDINNVDYTDTDSVGE